VHDERVVLGDGDLLGGAQVLQHGRLQLEAHLLGDDRAARQLRNVLQVGLAVVAKAGRLDRRHLEPAAQLVEHQRRERLGLDVLGDDHQRLVVAHDRLEQRQDGRQRGHLLLHQQDRRVLKLHLLRLGVVDKVRRDVAAAGEEEVGGMGMTMSE
jgi:hypothetical protein